MRGDEREDPSRHCASPSENGSHSPRPTQPAPVQPTIVRPVQPYATQPYAVPAAPSGFQDTLWVIGVLSLIGAGVALLIHDRDAAATMAPQIHAADGSAPASAPAH